MKIIKPFAPDICKLHDISIGQWAIDNNNVYYHRGKNGIVFLGEFKIGVNGDYNPDVYIIKRSPTTITIGFDDVE